MTDEPLPDLAAATLESVRRSVRGQRKADPRPTGRRTGRSPDAQLSGSGRGDRDPVLLGPSVTDLVSDRGWSASAAVGGVIGRWAEVAGEDLASHVAPESFDQDSGVLRLRAESTSWATQTRMLIPSILQRLSEEIGPDVVREIDVIGPAFSGPRQGRLRVPGRGPRDTYG